MKKFDEECPSVWKMKERKKEEPEKVLRRTKRVLKGSLKVLLGSQTVIMQKYRFTTTSGDY